MSKKQEIKGIFRLEDLEKTLIEANTYKKSSFNLMLRQLPSKSWIARKFYGQKNSNQVIYEGPVILKLTGYYDGSGENIYLWNSEYIRPKYCKEISFKDSLMSIIAQKNRVSSNGCEFYISSPTNQMDELKRRIKAVKTSEKELNQIFEKIHNKKIKEYVSLVNK